MFIKNRAFLLFMNCIKCDKPAVSETPALCAEHFNEYFEKKAAETIKKFDMLKKTDKVCVAASGGKDSVALLFVLSKFGYNIEALAIDEGIKGYRDKSLEFLKKFCKQKNISLRIYSFEELSGKKLDAVAHKYKPACNVCGTFRRYLLEKHSDGYDKIATGHNLDDESQAVLMNILKAQTALFARQGPITEPKKGFTQKVKPFYFLKEKEIMIYAFLNKLNVDFEECPYAPQSFRAHVRDLLNEEEQNSPGTKLNIVNKYLEEKKFFETKEEVNVSKCDYCGQPTSGLICKACRYKMEIAKS